jgi:hypothetical protein
MVLDAVPIRHLAPDQMRVLPHILTDHEEGRRCAMPPE